MADPTLRHEPSDLRSLLRESKRAHAILMSVGTFASLRKPASDAIFNCAESLAQAIRREETSRIAQKDPEHAD